MKYLKGKGEIHNCPKCKAENSIVRDETLFDYGEMILHEHCIECKTKFFEVWKPITWGVGVII
jgi:transcriptional regulator NrdR family protein